MNRWMMIERWCLGGHILSMAFGLAGLLWVMPHPEILEYLPAGPMLYRWSLAGGGVVYIVLGAIAVALYGCRTLGPRTLLSFLLPAVVLSLSSELLGTSTGLPFGEYSYLSGLGYKIAGLVPFTIPLSWFYLGISAYLLARGGLQAIGGSAIWRRVGAVFLGALLLMSWDFVLDPAMSQTAMPFWYWHTPGAFFGMPYQNFAGWFLTGALFMAVAAILWLRFQPSKCVSRQTLTTPLIVYLSNFAFATVMSLANGIAIPVVLGILVGAAPAIGCWYCTPRVSASVTDGQMDTSPRTVKVSATAPASAITK